ncbi:MAG: hypothetical protein HY905_18690 [Deltaproteobacteria bacterium]|nr:hypothetical protein [Deltaproteobacteria bacterium]
MRTRIISCALFLVMTVPASVVAQTGGAEGGTAAPAEGSAPAEGETAAGVPPFAELVERPGVEAATGPAAPPVSLAVQPSTAASAGGEDEGMPVPSAPPGGAMPPADLQAASGAVGEMADDGAGEDDQSWIARLDAVSEDSPLLQLRTGPLVIAPVGMVQFLGVPWQQDGARLANGGWVDEPGLRFRRVRIGFVGWAPYDVSFESISEFDEQGFQLLDLTMTWAPFEALALTAGGGKTPFSGSELTPAMFQTFLDRPWGVDGETADGERVGIAPGRMLGVWLSGKWSVLKWQAGVYNGNHDYFLGNDNEGVLVGARLECLPLGDMPEGQLTVEGGDPRVRIGASYYWNDDAPGDTHGVEGDVKFRVAGLTIEGEFLWNTFVLDADPTRPPGEPGDVRKMAYYAQVGYLVLDPWLDVSARFDSFEIDDGVDDYNDRWSVGGVATLFFLRNRVKLQLEYAHHQEWADPQIPNDSVALQLQGRF